MKRKLYWSVGIFLLMIVLIFGYSQYMQTKVVRPITETTYALDTICTITVFNEKDIVAMNEALNNLQVYHRLMDRHKESGSIYMLNTEGSIAYQEDIVKVVQYGQALSGVTNGKFSVFAKPLVELWGIGGEDFVRPEKEAIRKTIEAIGQSSISINDEIEVVGDLELGALAKGYIGDLVRQDLKDAGVESAIINLGGNVVLLGTKTNGAPWIVGVQSPEEVRGVELGYLSITEEKAIISSGIYERYSSDDQGRYHHILDATTGYPVDNELAQVTIIADLSLEGDGLSTAVFMMGLEDGRKYVESLEGVEAIFVTTSNDVYATSNAVNWFTLTKTDFTLK